MKDIKLYLPVCFVIVAMVILGCESPQQTTKPNVLLICIDDLRPELKSFGAEYIFSPNIDRLARSGVSFLRHYVNAPTCGASRYTLLTGQYGPPQNDALFKRAEKIMSGSIMEPSMPEWFRKNGYTTVSVGKVSHHPGGRGGADWNDNNLIEMPKSWDKHLMPTGEWQHPRGMMHGLANGEIRVTASEMDVFQSVVGEDDIYPDGLITNLALKELKELSSNEANPFFLAVGIIRPHLPFGAPKSYFDRYENIELPPIKFPNIPDGKTTWHPSREFMKYNRWGRDPNTDNEFAEQVRRHYAACVSYADAQVGRILAELKRSGADKNTVVVLWGDHGWHLGEHGIWGKHSLFEESLHSPLIIRYPGMKNEASKSNAVVETVDLFPTLCDLTGINKPGFIDGESLMAFLENSELTGNPAIAYQSGAKTIRTETHRMILHEDGFVELYDHSTLLKETKNLAEEFPSLVTDLKRILKEKLQD